MGMEFDMLFYHLENQPIWITKRIKKKEKVVDAIISVNTRWRRIFLYDQSIRPIWSYPIFDRHVNSKNNRFLFILILLHNLYFSICPSKPKDFTHLHTDKYSKWLLPTTVYSKEWVRRNRIWQKFWSILLQYFHLNSIFIKHTIIVKHIFLTRWEQR